ncbi:hypothetical protein [Nocardia beijingensis]|uniref:hypothetical protein n=1 Tax=Nocardia beijingensis TaxID=95162 RepID=UPI000835B1AA|nr:hypothetical protein [Nocardia beijingensis]
MTAPQAITGSAVISGLESGILRFNPDYDLVPLEGLADSERALLDAAGGDPHLYGVLRPRPGSALAVRTADCDTALLAHTLRAPGPIPGYVRRRLGSRTDATITALVLDGVLQLRSGSCFVCGPDAAATIAAPGAGTSVCSALSGAAVRYGGRLVGLTEQELSNRLYGYGRKPPSPRLRHRLGDPAAVEDFLAPEEADSCWAAWPTSARTAQYWRCWVRRDHPRPERSRPTFKLYVSPGIEAVPAVLPQLRQAAARAHGVVGYKLGRGLSGLCRPDKLIVYLRTQDDLWELAGELAARLGGLEPHGVPFTGAITADGLLSWGYDPPAPGGEPMSWRRWITDRLADYLLAAAGTGATPRQACHHALTRIELAGVDPRTWSPRETHWAAGETI